MPTLCALDACRLGEPSARDLLFERIYAELKRIARGTLRRPGPQLTISPSTLVHEVFLCLAGCDEAALADSRHFYRLIATAMRQIVIDLGRRLATAKPSAPRAGTVQAAQKRKITGRNIRHSVHCHIGSSKARLSGMAAVQAFTAAQAAQKAGPPTATTAPTVHRRIGNQQRTSGRRGAHRTVVPQVFPPSGRSGQKIFPTMSVSTAFACVYRQGRISRPPRT